ncbi:hypothetical protein HBH68_230830 [Parastagonospora nodorum]|nr:hypothetical protein HBH52_110470 [Parastagonospora nodorum]KAH5168096.1 hypothetical protein HBH68_230830 [Parastagonospora nodorum]KAH5304693.1 hypothetical protein HBI12_174030 [Parastagonospora nodorum]KAH6318341.1 hypothetical protein HBI39_021160 [Parastagonospora nodorum]KAH6468965.1 hypothetical protein HBI59_051960 [Parastagonospora nodorum]
MDSGLVDLNKAFGLNLPNSERVSYRRKTTCAVLSLPGHTSVSEANDFPPALLGRIPFPGEQIAVMSYGNSPEYPEKWRNLTLFYSLLGQNFQHSYSLKGIRHWVINRRLGRQSGFEAMDGMRPDEADVYVLVLGNPITYMQPVYDPWFLATVPAPKFEYATNKTTTFYVPDSLVRAMGCTVQHQYCMDTKSGQQCSVLDGIPAYGIQANDTQKGLETASPLQLSALQLLMLSNRMTDASDYSQVLASRMVRRDGYVAGQIPSDQWITEAKGMESFVWATLQIAIADYAIGPSLRSPDIAGNVTVPTTPEEKKLCGTQKMRKAGGFVNINVFGLAFVISISLFLALVDILLLKFIIYLDGSKKVLGPRTDRWIQDGVLQLQRRAYEAHGQGTWTQLGKDVPLTAKGEKLADLPLESRPIPTHEKVDDSTGTASPGKNPAVHNSSASMFSRRDASPPVSLRRTQSAGALPSPAVLIEVLGAPVAGSSTPSLP